MSDRMPRHTPACRPSLRQLCDMGCGVRGANAGSAQAAATADKQSARTAMLHRAGGDMSARVARGSLTFHHKCDAACLDKIGVTDGVVLMTPAIDQYVVDVDGVAPFGALHLEYDLVIPPVGGV